MTDQQPQAQLALERIYAKDLSFEVPSPRVFMGEWQPELDINLSSNAEQGGVAFIAEVHQAGVFLIENVSQEQLPHLLGAYCPNILFPFAREAISDIVTKGSFPQLLLAPINFDAAFAESQQRLQQQQAAEATGNA